MQTEFEKKNKPNNKFGRIIFISFIITICVLFILGILIYIYGDTSTKRANTIDISQIYHISGNILNTQNISKDINLVIEETSNDKTINAVTLKNNKKISKVELCKDIDKSNIKDFKVIIDDYDNDGKKDFTYISSKNDDEYIYKLYSINKSGEISVNDGIEVRANSNKASIKLYKTKNGYEYKELSFYYNGYLFPAQVGTYKFNEKSSKTLTTISPESKIAITGEFDALPRKYVIQNSLPEHVTNINDYLIQADNKQFTEIDLDNDGRKEIIVSFSIENSDNIIMLDDSANYMVTLLSGKNGENIKKNIEFADIDDDGVMEIIVINSDGIEVHKYSGGFYF